MSSGRVRHDAILDALEERVRNAFPDDVIHKEWDYDRGKKKVGEIDLLRITSDGTWIQYEVKSGARYDKAKVQYERFCKSFPEQTIKGIYLGKDGVKRL